HLFALRDQSRIVLVFDQTWEIAGSDGSLVRYADEVQARIRLEAPICRHRSGAGTYGCVQFAAPDFLQCVALRHIEFLHIDAEFLEDLRNKLRSGTALVIEVDLFPVQILDAFRIATREDLQRIWKERRDIGELPPDIWPEFAGSLDVVHGL